MFKFLESWFHIYGLLIGLGIWLALEVSLWVAKKWKVDKSIIERACLWAIVPGILGARIYHVIDFWGEYYFKWPVKAFFIWEGGMGIWGGILGGVVGLYFFWKKNLKKISFLSLLDIIVVGLPLGQSIGRWGNFANGELYGKPTQLPWGLVVNNMSTRVHPLFLYESLLDFALFLVLLFIVKSKDKREGLTLGVYLIGYGTIRFVLESFRPEDMVWRWHGIAVAQIWAIVAIILGVVLTQRHRAN